MQIEKTDLENVYLIKPNTFNDNRGLFVKQFDNIEFLRNDIFFNCFESFYSISHKNVLRGMHFIQSKNIKIISCISGLIMDVIVNINKKSKDFGKHLMFHLSDINKYSICINEDYAHGFLALYDKSVVTYLSSVSHNEKTESGILWNSFGFDWRINDPILSNRDKNFIKFSAL